MSVMTLNLVKPGKHTFFLVKESIQAQSGAIVANPVHPPLFLLLFPALRLHSETR